MIRPTPGPDLQTFQDSERQVPWWVQGRPGIWGLVQAPGCAWPGLTAGVGATARRSMDGRLSGAQAELALQEDSVRRSERERRAALDQVAALERSLQATESELRASQVGRGRARGGGICRLNGCL